MPIELELRLITIYTSRRYNQHRDRRPGLAQAYQEILDKAATVQDGGGDVGELLGFLGGPHGDIELARASLDVLNYIDAR